MIEDIFYTNTKKKSLISNNDNSHNIGFHQRHIETFYRKTSNCVNMIVDKLRLVIRVKKFRIGAKKLHISIINLILNSI